MADEYQAEARWAAMAALDEMTRAMMVVGGGGLDEEGMEWKSAYKLAMHTVKRQSYKLIKVAQEAIARTLRRALSKYLLRS